MDDVVVCGTTNADADEAAARSAIMVETDFITVELDDGENAPVAFRFRLCLALGGGMTHSLDRVRPRSRCIGIASHRHRCAKEPGIDSENQQAAGGRPVACSLALLLSAPLLSRIRVQNAAFATINTYCEYHR